MGEVGRGLHGSAVREESSLSRMRCAIWVASLRAARPRRAGKVRR